MAEEKALSSSILAKALDLYKKAFPQELDEDEDKPEESATDTGPRIDLSKEQSELGEMRGSELKTGTRRGTGSPVDLSTEQSELDKMKGSELRSGSIESRDFEGAGGYTYRKMPDGDIMIVKSKDGKTDGLVISPDGKNSVAYAAILKEMQSGKK